ESGFGRAGATLGRDGVGDRRGGPGRADVTGCDLRGRRPSASRGVPVVTYSGTGQTFGDENRCVLPDTRHKTVTIGTRPGRTPTWRTVSVVNASRCRGTERRSEKYYSVENQ